MIDIIFGGLCGTDAIMQSFMCAIWAFQELYVGTYYSSRDYVWYMVILKLHVSTCISARLHVNRLIRKLHRDLLMLILSQRVIDCIRLSHVGSWPRKSRGGQCAIVGTTLTQVLSPFLHHPLLPISLLLALISLLSRAETSSNTTRSSNIQ